MPQSGDQHPAQCADDEIQRLEMGEVEGLSCHHRSSVHGHSALYLERPCQSACVYRIGVQHICVLDKQPPQYPSGQPCLRIAMLADLRCDRPFMGRIAERVDHADLDSGVDHSIRLEGAGTG